MKRPTFIYFSSLALVFITLMFIDYNRSPYVQGKDYKGINTQYSEVIYPVVIVIEWLLIIGTINLFQRKIKLIYKIGIFLLWLGLAFFSFIDTMRGGGVIAAHAFWLLAVSISLAVLLLKKMIAPERRN